MWTINADRYLDRLDAAELYREGGKVTKSIGLVFEAYLPGAAVGSVCKIITGTSRNSKHGIDAEVIGFRDRRAVLMPFEPVHGISNGSLVTLKQRKSSVRVSEALLGRVLDAQGNAIDDKGEIDFRGVSYEDRPLYRKPSDPLKREIITDAVSLGVRSIDGLLTCGKGQRVGILAGSGVGKSVLLGTMARNTSADVNVIALVGERGREVREFYERDLGPEGLKRSILIVATSDTAPVLRMRAAYLAATIAEYFRDEGKDVLLLMDSITRFCMAQREIGLAMGEPPATKGYTPSVFSTLPRLLERSGTNPNQGSVTGLFTVLVEGDELDDPIADTARSLLDGHVVLSRKLAEKGHYPAVDVLQSTSRIMPNIVTKEQLDWSIQIREWMALYNDAEDLINIGAYVKGANPRLDMAVALNDRINRFLRQSIHETAKPEETQAAMHGIIRAYQAENSA